MKKEELRKIEFTSRSYRGNAIKKGYFHQWGLMSESNGDDTYYNVSVGIVEDEEGNVCSVYPATIKFLD